MLNPFDEASFLALTPDMQDFVAHLHASEGRDLDGAAGLLGVSVEAAREILARKDVAAAIEDLSIRVAGAKAAPPPRDRRSGWQKERDAKFARAGATDGQRAWNEKGGRPPAIDPAKFRDALLAGQTLGEAAATAGSRAGTKKDLGTIGSQYLSQRPELRAELLAAGWDPKAAWRRRMAARAASRARGRTAPRLGAEGRVRSAGDTSGAVGTPCRTDGAEAGGSDDAHRGVPPSARRRGPRPRARDGALRSEPLGGGGAAPLPRARRRAPPLAEPLDFRAVAALMSRRGLPVTPTLRSPRMHTRLHRVPASLPRTAARAPRNPRVMEPGPAGERAALRGSGAP